jgi:hypothetical protein
MLENTPLSGGSVVNKATMLVRTVNAFALCLLILAVPTAALAMDVDELIAKSIEATGGKDVIKSVKSMQIEGNILVQGMEIPFTMMQKRPGKLKIEAAIMGMSMTQCFADGQGWAINPMLGSTDPQPMPEMEAKSFSIQADMDGPLMDYKEKGFTATYVGEEDVEGTPAYRISLDNNDGMIMDFFLDKEFYLTILQQTNMTVDGNAMTTMTYMSDFQEVEGMVMPYSVETRMGGTVVSQIMFKTVVLNGDIDDAIFAMPVAAPIKE